MKFLHLGDLHLGKTLGDFDLIDDQKYILDQIISIIDDEAADAVLIAGDVYDRSIPSEAATRLLDSFLSKLASKNIKTYMISGNHDSDDRLNYGSSLFESNNIFISAIYNGRMDKHILKNGENEINVYMLPFVKSSHVKHFYPEEKIDNYEDAVRVVLEHSDIDENKCNILVAHQFVAGKGVDPSLGGSESVATRSESVGTVEKIGYDLFDKFDYVALGHIHRPQSVGREAVRYSGSILKYSLSEAGNDKSVPVITVNDKNEVDIKLVPLKPHRDLRHIKGDMDKLLDKANVSDPDDYIYATLTDENYINDAMGIFQQVYPNTVRIDYENSHTHDVEQIDISTIAEDKPFPELISDFYKMIYGCEITDEEMDVMMKAAREAGVIDEAN
ncbi:Exodeoxyribonuclease I subunit D [Eubacterium ruminantium]|uniref:Nuclease SbcCD subunit D n=1 Tax=Eubacterium ruminantium TaxID=42322 RepID=A0A1T4LPV4_9FIRM|nr:exonuclease SbcCD subunit D [Eubacterium ruminantium]SCW40616.1 Exodeoxyribonuclease I subunit D [Eubacterium ruminantium]SDM38883.1 Exodeoxyribonuclease I subunit D [Eubacterium ruminantium]SJZ56725.1 Exodeoxyribonuclease I subunit D [Eubacterium ruminantium]